MFLHGNLREFSFFQESVYASPLESFVVFRHSKTYKKNFFATSGAISDTFGMILLSLNSLSHEEAAAWLGLKVVRAGRLQREVMNHVQEPVYNHP
jgi:hypothetical protein